MKSIQKVSALKHELGVIIQKNRASAWSVLTRRSATYHSSYIKICTQYISYSSTSFYTHPLMHPPQNSYHSSCSISYAYSSDFSSSDSTVILLNSPYSTPPHTPLAPPIYSASLAF